MYLPTAMLTCCAPASVDAPASWGQHVYIDLDVGYAFATDGHMAIRVPITPGPEEVSGYVSQDAIRYAGRHGGHVTHGPTTTVVQDVVFPNPRPRLAGSVEAMPYPVARLMDWFAIPHPAILHLDVRRLLRLAVALQLEETAASRHITLAYQDATERALLVRPWHEGPGRVAEALLMPLRAPHDTKGAL